MENIVKEKVKILLNIEQLTEVQDFLIDAYIQEILAYCYRDELTEKMILPVADVIAFGLKNKAIYDINGNVTSYKEGDLAITFATSTNGVQYNGKLEGFKLIRGLMNV